ncbi:Myc-type [Macleaya cordata]|uniref:Myc-type n=1 Tax=Macleaya cordata TaxID=56857 RepID=A0A200QWE9_MACCD|nr:Myc-type [Macleaya cordata]
MEKFQGPTNQCLFGASLDVERGLEQGQSGFVFSYGAPFLNTTGSFRFQEEDQQQNLQQQQEEESLQQSFSLSIPLGLEDKMPFLEMLQSEESPPYSPFAEPPPPPDFQVLLTSQYQQQQQRKPCGVERRYLSSESAMDYSRRMQAAALELESCITTTTNHNDMASESYSPVKSETNKEQEQEEQACPPNYSSSSHPVEVVSSSLCCNGELFGEPPNSSPEENCRRGVSSSTTCCWVGSRPKMTTTTKLAKPEPAARVVTTTTNGRERERKKRKRTRPSKNREEVESQRMTHIAVERNRRRQMNDHLNALRSLMPPSFIQRGDQASIIGGAIDFVKELEQLLQSLEAKNIMRLSSSEEEEEEEGTQGYKKYYKKNKRRSSNSSSDYSMMNKEEEEEEEEEVMKCVVGADIEVIVVQTHVNLKILTPRRPGQLLRAIAALEDLRLTILHLNVTSFQLSVLYSLNLKIEDDCRLGTSADEIATAVHQIFSYINGGGDN